MRLCFFFLLIIDASALVCISHHDYYESGKRRTITHDHCRVNPGGYCIKAVYAEDANANAKHGYSRGCDKTDCAGFDDDRPNGVWMANGCRRHVDFGADGLVCCCRDRDACNRSTTNRIASTVVVIGMLIVMFLDQ